MRRLLARIWRWIRTGSPFKARATRTLVDARHLERGPIPVLREGAPTVQVPPLIRGVRMSFDLADPDAVADFLSEASAVIRAKRRVVISFE